MRQYHTPLACAVHDGVHNAAVRSADGDVFLRMHRKSERTEGYRNSHRARGCPASTSVHETSLVGSLSATKRQASRWRRPRPPGERCVARTLRHPSDCRRPGRLATGRLAHAYLLCNPIGYAIDRIEHRIHQRFEPRRHTPPALDALMAEAMRWPRRLRRLGA